MEMKHILVKESFIAKFAKKLFLCFFSFFLIDSLPQYPWDELFPAEERPLLPLLFEHFFCLLVNLSKLYQRIGTLEEILQVLT